MGGITSDSHGISHRVIIRYHFLVLLVNNAGEAQVLTLIRA